jgi:N-acetyl-gamma-glutamyl-phosphate reductase
MSPTFPVIVLGGSGYVAGEMLRLIALHPRLELAAAVSTSQVGEPVRASFAHLGPVFADTGFVSFDALLARLGEAEHWVVLSAAPHGASADMVGRLLAAAEEVGTTLTVVDASADFRFTDAAQFAAIYGQAHPTPDRLTSFTCALPEHRATIATPHAAHPGCFATAMLLGIVPLVASGLAGPDIYVSAVTGSTGAGRSPRETTHHPVRQSNLFAYQALVHRHDAEVAALTLAATAKDIRLNFVPHSGPFARGIHATIFAPLSARATAADVNSVLADYYRGTPFVHVTDAPPRMKDIAGSNYAMLNASVNDRTVVVCSVIDNLLKGAAGGAMQWVNRLLGLDETTGLTAPAAGWL